MFKVLMYNLLWYYEYIFRFVYFVLSNIPINKYQLGKMFEKWFANNCYFCFIFEKLLKTSDLSVERE